jgi:prevent-host-death family protein
MATITAFEAKTRFGELLERVSKGEEIIITRHDKPVARIVPEGAVSIDRVHKAVDSMIRLQEIIAKRTRGEKPLQYDEVKSAIEEGRE